MAKEITRDLFYSTEEGILFWVAGYTRDGNTNSVKEIVQSLEENAKTFAEKAEVDFDKVLTLYNERPPRYQYMRIFYAYCKNKGGFELGKDWTMYKWLNS